jgi:hypothetical protein
MRALLWLGSVAAFVIWSLFAWIAYGLVEVVFALVGASMAALLGGWAGWLTDAAGDIGQVLIVLVWLLVGVVILGVPRLLGGPRELRRAD